MPYSRMGARSKRLVLRPWKVSDFRGWVAGNEALLPKRNPWDIPPPDRKWWTAENFAKRVRHQREIAKAGHVFNFGVFDRKTGEWRGGIDLFIISPKIRCANLGYYVLNTHWGKGIAPEASRLALDIAFKQLNLRRVEASCELKNKASARVALKAGMFKEGLRRKYPIPAGLRDLYVFGMNCEDWKKVGKSKMKGARR
jgi:ribosomal-protein-alanine N-acetyltransferase